MSRFTLPRRWFLVAGLLVIATAAAAQQTVVVNTTSGTVDGNTGSIALLNLAPGPGGAISLMEAIAAANNTAGPKKITFTPALRGKAIPFGSNDLADIRRFSLKSGDLILDGDVDGDGSPDVAIDATGNDLATIHIRASNVTIVNLIFREFGTQALNFACEDPECQPHAIANVRVAGNVFESRRGGALEMGAWGLLGPSNAPSLSTISFTLENVVFDRNTVRGPLDAFANGVGIRACSNGVANSRYSKISVTNNSFSIFVAIDAGAADDALPPYYSDHCELDHLVVDANLIEDANRGIGLASANLGNQYNTVRHIRITNNRVLRATLGLLVGTAYRPNLMRSTSFNAMDDLLISGNEIEDCDRAILLSAGNPPLGPVPPNGVDDNTQTDAAIIGNVFRGYRSAGILVFGAVGSPNTGGHSSSRNRIDGLTIAGNTFEAAVGGSAIGLGLVAGQSNGGGGYSNGIAADNEIRHVRITGNTFRHNRVALSLNGGVRPGATGNLLSIEALSANLFDENAEDQSTVVDAEGATGNRIELPPRRRRSVRH